MPSITEPDIATIQRKYRCRIESLLSVDDGVRRIIDALSASGELGDTLIVFTSDNGFFHGEHRVQSGKNRVYEEAIRVPLVIRGPEVPAGVTVGDTVDQRRPRARPSSTPRARPPGCPRTGARCFRSPLIPTVCTAASC